MGMKFEFATAGRILFGSGSSAQAGTICRGYGTRSLIVTGARPERADFLGSLLPAAGVNFAIFPVRGEPTLAEVCEGAERARQLGAELIVGIGGGSAVDAAKAVAALATQPQGLMQYLEVIGAGYPLEQPPLPVIAIPTTAGTGAEVTRNAVLSSPEHHVKASLRHAAMLPRVAILDPVLALTCPPEVTAASGMDALTQCLEAYVSCRAQPMTDALCWEGIHRAMASLEQAVINGTDLQARENMTLAAMLSGMALANAGLGAVHGFAAPVGGQFHAPHGAICAALLAPVWQANVAAVEATGTEDQRGRFQRVAALLTGRPQASAAEALPVLHGLATRLRIPRLAAYGIEKQHLDPLAIKASQASSMKGNPVPLPQETLVSILKRAL